MSSKTYAYNPDTDIPSLEGKSILITGANSGLGKQASLEFAKHKPAQIWMAARSSEKGNAALAEVKAQVPDAPLTFLELDLTSFASIKSAAKKVLESAARLDILMLNAGSKSNPMSTTSTGPSPRFLTPTSGSRTASNILPTI